MYNIKQLLFLLKITLIISCSENFQPNPNHNNQTKIYKLTEVDEVTFEIDSLTPYYSNCIQYIPETNLLMALNSLRGNLDFYSYQQKKLVNRIILNSEFFKSSKIDGAFYINKDSILLASSSKGSLVIINNQGKILKEYLVTPSTSNNYFSSPTISTSNPPIIKNHELNISGLLGPRVNPFSNLTQNQMKNLNLSINLNLDEYIANLAYPNCYLDKFWGANMMMFYRVYNDSTQDVVYSFPANHNLLITDLKQASHEIAGGSSLFNKISSMNESELTYKGRMEYYLRNPSYGPIIYDKFNKMYYRIAYQAISDGDIASNELGKSQIKHASIIVLDKDFNFVGETILPRFSYTETMFFVNEIGLHLGKWEKSKLNENQLVFGVFKLLKNEDNL